MMSAFTWMIESITATHPSPNLANAKLVRLMPVDPDEMTDDQEAKDKRARMTKAEKQAARLARRMADPVERDKIRALRRARWRRQMDKMSDDERKAYYRNKVAKERAKGYR